MNMHYFRKKLKYVDTKSVAELRLMGYYQTFLQSVRWKKIKANVISFRGNKCEQCGAVPVEVHHRTYTGFWEGAFKKFISTEDPENFLMLCRDCHQNIHDLYCEDQCPLEGKYCWNESEYWSGGCSTCGNKNEMDECAEDTI